MPMDELVSWHVVFTEWCICSGELSDFSVRESMMLFDVYRAYFQKQSCSPLESCGGGV